MPHTYYKKPHPLLEVTACPHSQLMLFMWHCCYLFSSQREWLNGFVVSPKKLWSYIVEICKLRWSSFCWVDLQVFFCSPSEKVAGHRQSGFIRLIDLKVHFSYWDCIQCNEGRPPPRLYPLQPKTVFVFSTHPQHIWKQVCVSGECG